MYGGGRRQLKNMSSRFNRQRLTGGLLLVLIPESIHGRLPFLWNPARKERTTVDGKNPAPLMMYNCITIPVSKPFGHHKSHVVHDFSINCIRTR